MEIFIDGREISGSQLDRDEVKSQLEIIYPQTKLSSIIIYDESAPYPDHPSNSPYVHYLVINVRNSDIATGNIIFSYKEPSPPKDSAPHHYVVKIYGQKFETFEKYPSRINFDIKNFERDRSLLYESDFIVHNSPGDNPYCDCVLDVVRKQPTSCLSDRSWFQQRRDDNDNMKTCYNPWAVCSSTTHRKGPCKYNYEDFDDELLRKYAEVNRISSRGKSRQDLIDSLYNK